MANDNDKDEVKGSGANWSKTAVRDAHGVISIDATLDMVREELANVADNEVDVDEIRVAVSAVFNKLSRNGEAEMAMIDMNGLTTNTLNALGDVPMGSETRTQKRIADFVRGESKRFEETAGEEGAYHIKRGKQGGVALSTTKYVANYRKAQAEKAKRDAK